MKFFSNELSNLNKWLIFLFFKSLEKGVPLAEEEVKDWHDDYWDETEVRGVVEEAASTSEQETDTPYPHENNFACKLANRLDISD